MICIFAMAPKMRFYNFLESNGLFSFLTWRYTSILGRYRYYTWYYYIIRIKLLILDDYTFIGGIVVSISG